MIVWNIKRFMDVSILQPQGEQAEESMEEQTKAVIYSHMTPAQWLMRLLHGALIGVGSILPGVSGGVLCVLFGIYQPMMALLAHPFQAFKKYFKLFIPVGIGFVLGFVGLAKLVEWAFGENSNIAVCLFLGLIAGTLPSLWREAGERGRKHVDYVGMAVAFAALIVILKLFESGSSVVTEPNALWYLFCGAVWGLSLIVPGLSSSTILIFMGLYQPLTGAIGRLDFAAMLPFAAGILAVAFGLAKPVEKMLEKKYSLARHIICGVVLASSIMILPTSYNGEGELALCAVCFVVGLIGAIWLDRFGRRINAG